jgi:alkanesulfonate monooxygenase SsuD/methylene tetrahydromethanopterin reductase-like flavin-dependent oxidoreductase (luciferase family)
VRVGIALPISERGEPPRATPYAEMRRLALLAEAGGLDSIWVADHLFFQSRGLRGAWESWTILAALAEATSRVELGPLVLCTPFRNPGLIAWMANTLDEVSGGRLVLGLGSGWHKPEFDGFGFEFDHRVSFLDDALSIIVPLLREGRADHAGRFARGQAELHPRGPRAAGPPIMIAASKPRMMRLTAQWADRWNSVWYGLPTYEFRSEREGLARACTKAGREPTAIEATVGVVVREDATTNNDEQLAAQADRLADGFAAWRAEGVGEVICRMEPASPALVETVVRAAESLRTGEAPLPERSPARPQ